MNTLRYNRDIEEEGAALAEEFEGEVAYSLTQTRNLVENKKRSATAARLWVLSNYK